MERCPCCENALTNERAWTKEEDDRLFAHIKAHGEGSWRSVPEATGLHRCGKSCQLRWINCLLPDVQRWNISEDEEELIVRLHALLGNRWSLIAGRLPGRTGNEIRNYWNTHINKKLLSRETDPKSHRPIHYVDNQSSSSNIQSLNHQIKTVDFLQYDGDGISGNFEGATSNAGKRNEEPPDVNLDLSISLPCYNRQTADSNEISK